MPAAITPRKIAINAFLGFIPNRVAATVPVHAPVTGRGIATKRTNPQNLQRSTTFERLPVRLN